MRRSHAIGAVILAVLLPGAALPAFGAPASQPSVTMEIKAGKSTPLGIIPAADGANFFYYYTTTDGGSITDTIPVNLCVNASSGTWTSFKLSFGDPHGALASSVAVPAETTFSSASLGTLPSCTPVAVTIMTGTLNLANPNVAETREANINIQQKDREPPNLQVSFYPNRTNIKIRVTINPAANDTACFITDSSGDLLTNCAGVPVTDSGSNAGRFSIVVNKKKNIEVATNPGQFYYNILWENKTGSPQTVNVNFARSGVLPKGAQAIHAWAFPPPFSGISMADFETVNDGIPGGSDDLIQDISVPDGWTLWVNYHLEWAGIGGAPPADCATTCGDANQAFSVTGAITGGVSRECAAGAKGYKK